MPPAGPITDDLQGAAGTPAACCKTIMSDVLSSWNDGAARSAILDFVARVTKDGGPDYVPPAGRVATFDNDGTLREFAYDRAFRLSPLSQALDNADRYGLRVVSVRRDWNVVFDNTLRDQCED
jgi:hypothetical protein